MATLNILDDPIGIIGAGAAGLIVAHILLKDGFRNVTLLTRDRSVGGTWARQRIYDGLFINNVHGEYRFSDLPMPQPTQFEQNGGRLSGPDLCEYMELFYQTFLHGKIKLHIETTVLDIRKGFKTGWDVEVASKEHKTHILHFSRIILATGGCSNPSIPPLLSQEAADNAGFRGMVLHSSEFASKIESILSLRDARQEGDSECDVLVVGGGKSAQDISSKLATSHCKVVVVRDKGDAFLAYPKPLPDFIRKSRLLGIFAGPRTLNSRLERFLHQTRIGSFITSFFWRQVQNLAFYTFKIPQGSSLRDVHPLFWTIRANDDGNFRPDSYHALTQKGVIEVINATRALRYLDDGKSVLLDNGRVITPKVVVLATGYRSSWEPIIRPEVAADIGIGRHEPHAKVRTTWAYTTLRHPPIEAHQHENWVSSNYRGLVPAKSIMNRDIAIMGSLFTGNPGYTYEVSAHWIASYFRGDRMRLPASVEEAIVEGETLSMWTKTRYPGSASWSNESYSGSFDFWTWPQAVDELLEDMHLPTCRSGGNWLTWPFKVIALEEIAKLTEERRERRSL